MADPANVERLIVRLEAASEGNRGLDYAIWTCSGQPYSTIEDKAPHYTTSLDAALTLVPEGYAWSVQSSPSFPGQAWLYPPNNIADIQYQADASSASLALCIAALRARLSAASLPETPEA